LASRIARIFLKVVAGMVGLAALFLAFAYWYDSTGQRPDPTFDSTVARPTYGGDQSPRVVFDVGHRNWHTPTDRYRPLADLLRHDGYTIAELNEPFSAETLTNARVLVIANAMGPDNYEGRPAFTPEEEIAVADWVRAGGSLLLIADHAPFGGAAQRLARRFGVVMYLTYARDDTNHYGWDNEKLLFSRGNGLLTAGPIADGRNASERVDTVVSFTGQSLSVPAGAMPVLRLSDEAYDWESRAIRHSARGHAQAVALTFGKGRVVILGEAGMLSAQVDPIGVKMGMNSPGNDNRRFALNLFHWLSNANH